MLMKMMMMMEDAIKTEERSMENEIKFDDKLPLTTENFIEIEKHEQLRQQQQQQLQQQQHEKWDISAHRRDNDNTHSNALNINTQQQTRRQLQEADTIPLHNSNSSFSKSKNITTATSNNNNNHANTMNYTSKRAAKAAAASAVGTRCGEIFVANSGRKWTFICTYCNKSTRDIGAFILHLKKMHLNGIYTETSETEEDEEEEDFGDALSFDERACNTSGHEQDYVDYSHFLDVNVHTPAEELQYNNNVIKPATTITPKLNETGEVVVVKKRGPGRPPGSRNNPDNKKEAILKNMKQQQKKSMGCMNGDLISQCSTDGIDGSSLMDIAEYEREHDEKMWPGFKQEANETVGSLDADEDFDNQLLFMPPPMGDTSQHALDVKSESGSTMDSVRTVRRQIRGTAYCALCNKTFQYYSLYRNHMTKHSNETPFKCILCKKGFKSKQAIRYHMHTHEKEKRHKCPLCHAAYYTENQVITHLLSHENGSIFPCMVCGKILRSDAERDQHLTTHTEERPYRCEYCNKLFRLRHHLSNHLKIHRQYRCDFCKSTFISALHQRKPYACNICSKHPHVQRQIEQAHSVATASSTSSSAAAAAPNNQSGASGTAGGTVGDNNSLVNPLHLFDTLGLPKPPKSCNDIAEMVSEASSENNSSSNSSSSSSSSSDDDDDDDDNVDHLNDGNENGVNLDVNLDTQIKSENNLTAAWLNGLDNMLHHSSSTNASVSASANMSEKQRLSCTYCSRTYSNVSALNYHVRQKHVLANN